MTTNMTIRNIFILACLMINNCVYSQKDAPILNNPTLVMNADSLKNLGHEILYGATDSIRINANENFSTLLEKSLNADYSFLFPFDSVKNVSILYAPDNSFRIMTWNMPAVDGSHYSYFGYVQTYNKKKSTSKVFKLTDHNESLEKPEFVKLSPDNWYGAVYYKMVFNQYHGKKYFTLLGFHFINQLKSQKVMETMMVSGDKVVFGMPNIKYNKKSYNRMLFTYSAKVVMLLHYDEIKNKIICDHIQPEDKLMEGQYEYYGPDGSYDDFIFKGGNWIIESDMDMRNGKDRTSGKPKTPFEFPNH